MTDSTPIALVIGVGAVAGIGAQCALRYAAEGARVVISGRTEEKLATVVREADERGLHMQFEVADCTDPVAVQGLYDAVEARQGTPSLVHYNTGNNMPGLLTDIAPDYFEQCWRLGAYGGFLCASEAVRRMRAGGLSEATILFTGASASLRGRAHFGAFNSAKGALRLMAQALAKEVGPEGIHVGHVVVDGAVDGNQIHTKVSEYAKQAAAEGKLIQLGAIVDAFCFLWRQPRSGWSFEVDVRTGNEPW